MAKNVAVQVRFPMFSMVFPFPDKLRLASSDYDHSVLRVRDPR